MDQHKPEKFNCGHPITVENMTKGAFKKGKQYYKCLTCQVARTRARRQMAKAPMGTWGGLRVQP